MNDDQIRALVEESVARALAEKDIEVASAIGDALRTYADRPVGEKGSPSLQYGVVDAVFDEDGWAAVILDGQTESVPIMMLGGLVEGERVAVLLVPPSGSLAIGQVTPTVPPPGSGGSFPVGPLDDGAAIYLIEGGGNLTFPQSVVTSAIDNSSGVVGLVVAVGQNADGGVILSGGTPDGGGAVLLVNAQEANFAQIGLDVEADGAESGQIQLTSTTGGDSAATITATDISLVATDDISLVATDSLSLDAASVSIGTSAGLNLGFYGAAGASQPTVTGSRGGNAAVASLLTALANQGLIVDSSTA